MNGKERRENLLGQELGWLTVIKLHHRDRANHWLCRCRCGQERIHTTNYLLGNKGPRSCGCNALTGIRAYVAKKALEITKPKKYHALLPIAHWRTTKNGVYWECRCDCGRTIYVRAAELKAGKRQSCGCVRDKQLKERNAKDTKERLIKYQQELPGTQIYNWTVLSVFLNERRRIACKVRCICGKEGTQVLTAIRNGHSKSCGCIQRAFVKGFNAARGKVFREQWKTQLVGKKFGKLTITDIVQVEGTQRSVVQCQCDCGQVLLIERYHVVSGKRKQCPQCKNKQRAESKRKKPKPETQETEIPDCPQCFGTRNDWECQSCGYI